MVALDILLTILRVVTGLLLFGHGSRKLFGWFGGKGLTPTSDFLGHLGFHPSRLWAVVLGLAEFLGGLSLVFGFLTPIGAAIVIGDMVLAVIKIHTGKGLWDENGGYEYYLTLIASTLIFGLSEPQLYSLDHYFNLSWTPDMVFVVTGIITLIVVIIALLTTAIHMPSRHQPMTN